MTYITPQKIAFEQIAEYILRDSAVWRNVPLFYAQLTNNAKKQHLENSITEFMNNNPDALLFNNDSDYIILGAKSAPEFGDCDCTCFWASNIAEQWQKVCDELSKFCAKKPVFQNMAALKSVYSVLIVEDEPLLNKIMSKYISNFGTVIATSNYREAIANYMVERPAIVFLDIHYHNDDWDGFDALKNLITTDHSAFIVMVSGDGNLETKIRALELGAQGFITKPFQPHDFEHYITKLNSSRKLV